MTDVILDPGSPSNLGTGNAQSSETVIQLQGSNCAATGHSGSVGPASGPTIANLRGCFDAGNNVARSDTHIHIWVRDLYPIRDVEVGGVSIYLSNATAASDSLYFVTGLNKGYAGGWFHAVINLDSVDRPAASVGGTGTPAGPNGNITEIGYEGNISASKGEDFLQNCYFDAVRSGTLYQGITLKGGTTGDRLTFADLADADTASYGLFRNVGGAFRIEGPIIIGQTLNDTFLEESLKVVNFANLTVNNGTGGTTVVPSVAPDYYLIELKTSSGGPWSTTVKFTDVTFNGVSRDVPFGFETAELGGIDVYTSLRTTYVFGEVIRYNAFCTSDSDTFIECQQLDLAGAIGITDPTFSNCDKVDLTHAGCSIDGGSTTGHSQSANIGFMITDDLEKISNHSFDNLAGVSLGSAIDITTVGTYDLDGVMFTGYTGPFGSRPTPGQGPNKAAIINSSGGLVTINILGGGTIPSIRNTSPGSNTVVIAGSVTTQVTVVTSDGTPVNQARVLIQAATGGPLPFADVVTITNSGTTASVSHTAHGMENGDEVKISQTASLFANRGVFVISNVTTNAYDYTMASTPGSNPTGTITATFVALSGLTNGSGVLSRSRVFASNQPISGRIRRSTTAPLYKTTNFTATIDSVLGFSAVLALLRDGGDDVAPP